MQVITKLDKVRQYNIRNSQPQTVIVFKLYSGKTPVEIFKLLGSRVGSNNLPYDLWGIKTRIDYNYAGYEVDCSECLIFFKVTGDLPPRIEIPNVLYCYRKGVDSKLFDSILYKEIFRLDGKYIQIWDFDESRKKIKVLKDLISSYVEKEKQISLKF